MTGKSLKEKLLQIGNENLILERKLKERDNDLLLKNIRIKELEAELEEVKNKCEMWQDKAAKFLNERINLEQELAIIKDPNIVNLRG